MQQFEKDILGVMSGFDRVLFAGHCGGLPIPWE